MPRRIQVSALPMSSSPSASHAHFAALSDPGQVREHNEDALLCNHELGLWAVADGMGGHQRGEVASALAVKVLQDEVARGIDLLTAVRSAHAAIMAAAAEDSASRGMGTTLVAVQLQGIDFRLAWVGDSRAYRISAQQVEQLSRDHSWVQAMVDAGEMTAQQARQHPRRNVITQCLGLPVEEFEPGFVQGQLQPGEILLLCSDGLSTELEDEQILGLSTQAATLDGLVSALVDAAKQHGGKDNISCIVLAPSIPLEPASEPRKRGLFGHLFALRKRA